MDGLSYVGVDDRIGMRELSVSCGYVITEPESSLSLQDYIKAADDVMYEIKRSVHAGD